MDITFSCTKCGTSIVIDAAGAGLQVNCPKCQAVLVVPQISQNTEAERVLLPPITHVPVNSETAKSNLPNNIGIKLIVGFSIAAVLFVGVVALVISCCLIKSHSSDPYTLGFNTALDAVRADNHLHSWPYSHGGVSNDHGYPFRLADKNGFTNEPNRELFISGCRDAFGAVQKQSRIIRGGTILQVVSNRRVLVQYGDETILVDDYFDGIDGDRVTGQFYYVGTYSYGTVLGANKTVRKYTAAPATVLSR